MAVLKEGLNAQLDSAFAAQVYDLFDKSIYHALELDYAVTHVTNEIIPAKQGQFGAKAGEFSYEDGSGAASTISKVELQRKGDWVFPVEVLIRFEDGSTQTRYWSGEEGIKIFEFTGSSKAVSAHIDPYQKIGLDVDLNNNSLTLQPATNPLWKYTIKTIFWVQNLLQTVSLLG